MRRFIIAGTDSGCGKTTVSQALMRALTNRGQRVQPFKVGPDYIDPGFHRVACGKASHNLDAHLMKECDIRFFAEEAARGADIAVIEGVMGYFDGAGSGLFCSTFDMARILGAPVLLVIDASGSAQSAAAVALGFQTMHRPNRISGVIVNRCSSERHFELVRDGVHKHTGLPCVGWMKEDASLNLKSRHLGLIPAVEDTAVNEKIEGAASALTMDFDALFSLTRGLSNLPGGELPPPPNMAGFRMGIAMDAAFHFYYEANLSLLRKSGVTLIPFSPLADDQLPGNLHGLYIGGGYPEVFAERLSRNESMRRAMQDALNGGLRCYAECGGLMYLTKSVDNHPMVGFLDAECRMTDKLQHFGYCQVELSGNRFPAHEFHHSELHEGDIEPAFTASGLGMKWVSGYKKGNTLAQYPHVHFVSRPELIKAFWG